MLLLPSSAQPGASLLSGMNPVLGLKRVFLRIREFVRKRAQLFRGHKYRARLLQRLWCVFPTHHDHPAVMFSEPEHERNKIAISAAQAKLPKSLMKQVDRIGGQRNICSVLFREMLMDRSHPELRHHVSPGAHLGR